MSPATVALGYFVAGLSIVPLVLYLFKTQFTWIDIGMAAAGGAFASLIQLSAE